MRIFAFMIQWLKLCSASIFVNFIDYEIFSMGGACSRKRDQRDNEDGLLRGLSGRYRKSGSSKWLATSFSRPAIDIKLGRGNCPSLLDLCIRKICEVPVIYIMFVQDINSLSNLFFPYPLQDIDGYRTFSMLPRDISQQIFDELVYSQRLTDVSLEAFRDCNLQVAHSDYLESWFLCIFRCYVFHQCSVCHDVLLCSCLFSTGSILGRLLWGE